MEGWCNQGAYINSLVQDCSNPSAKALELLQSCTRPWIHFFLRNFLRIPSLGFPPHPPPPHPSIFLRNFLRIPSLGFPPHPPPPQMTPVPEAACAEHLQTCPTWFIMPVKSLGFRLHPCQTPKNTQKGKLVADSSSVRIQHTTKPLIWDAPNHRT